MEFNSLNVSVIIPTCNRPRVLGRACASVNASLECIFVVDDCSSASVQGEVLRVCQRDTRVQLLNHGVRKGASFCRNLGAEQSQTDWLLFLDDDDQLCNGYLDSMKPLLESNPEVQAWIPDVQGGRTRNLSLVPLSDALTRNRVGGCSGLLIRKALFESIGGFDENFPSMQDWELWLRLIEHHALHYSGIIGVVYDSSSNQKITHNLRSKYQGLRKLYFKHANLWPPSARQQHVLRLWVLRRLLSGRRGLLENWLASRFQLRALYYTYRWRCFAPSQTSPSKETL